MAKSVMIQGTMSNAGKSLISAGLCRIFRQDGYAVSPFKSQNMALNSFITEDGKEMGRAQVVQAEAAGIKPMAEMNPVLLKPTSDSGSQVIVRGIPIGNMAAAEYFAYKKMLIPDIMDSYRKLSQLYEILVIEGAGSPAEINLKQDDIVNMGLAEMVDAPVLLVGDIDRGGVFAQLYGTMMLLEPWERARVKGLIINKFRGDKTLLNPGLSKLESMCQAPVLGVVPYLDVRIEGEDSLSQPLSGKKKVGLIDIAVVRFPRLSNYTDFDSLSLIPGVSIRYLTGVEKRKTPDLVILPGTKNTLSDLGWMRQNGLEAWVLQLAAKGIPVFGICGGYQMMGSLLRDPEGTESGQRQEMPGMNLFPVETVFGTEKIRTRVFGAFSQISGIFSGLSGLPVEGYEIHMGQSFSSAPLPIAQVTEYQNKSAKEKAEGSQNQNLYGTYLHGIFDGPGVAAEIARSLMEKKGYHTEDLNGLDYGKEKERQYDKLARELRASLNMDFIYDILKQQTERG